ncbi:thioredoxin family protein [Pseudomonas turukhanskensis]|uniref:Thioredoxin family protein n=1 Tax=Pseudomonas turukhanskensis TaxID=1806536 RepID=A0A9W6NG70_9PSED|nr:thioredoxin family protein [Pseudomonas turukhanskensis]GLK89743.1 thioredoxin family protein [Pseudomonas turukhanskensis]
MTTARYYHAGCPVCIEAEQTLLGLLDPSINVEIVHLGEQAQRVSEAEQAGVKSVPALVVEGQVLHLNFGAAIADLK